MPRQTLASGLDPQIGEQCRILVLGSMPGTLSLRAVEYYANPRNLFWDCVETAFGIDRDLSYQTRLSALYRVNVGLWDVLATCSRHASSDATIRGAQCNDFVHLLKTQPQIERICLNGSTAFNYWRRLVMPSFGDAPPNIGLGINTGLGINAGLGINTGLGEIEIIHLPSTSPANAGMARAVKIDAWCAALTR